MTVSIKRRIYGSFFILVLLFIANGMASLVTIANNRKLSENVSNVINPSLQTLEDLDDLLIASKMYTTNWVFLRSNQADKDALQRLHNFDYPLLKAKLGRLSVQWNDKKITDSLHKLFTGFEELLTVEKGIMSLLQTFEDYDDPVAKFESEMLVEDKLLPHTGALIHSLTYIISHEIKIRDQKNSDLEASFMHLRMLISLLAVTIIFLGIFLSLYMARVIIRPINKIREIVNDLGSGITRKVTHKVNHDEIGEMVRSVNNLSEKLHGTAAFATEIGNRNFDSYFAPLGPEDTLGIALVTMRNNLKASDQSLNEAQRIAKLGSWERDVKTGEMKFSDEMFRIFDIDPATFTLNREALFELIHPEDKSYYKSVSIQALNDHKTAAFEIRIITPQGVIKNIFVQSNVELDASGEVCKTFGILQDFTERKIVEQQIKLSNERYELITKTTHDMIWDLDLVNNTIFRNENYSKVFGTDGGDRNDVGKWIRQVHPDDKEGVAEHIRKKLDDPDAESWEVEFRYYRYDEEMAYLYDRGYIIRDENKKAIRMVGATCDITERKKAEAALHKSEERYRQIVETAQEGIWLSDENNNTTFVNKKMCVLLEYSQEELLGEQNDFLKNSNEPQSTAVQDERSRQPHSETHDCRFITKSGKVVWTSISTNPVFDDNGTYKGALAMVTDITRRKQDEELLQRSQARLSHNNRELEQKNKELEQFAYVASHDLQEPLRTTISFVEIFKKQYYGRLDANADKYLNYIVQASGRMSSLIKDLLDFSRIGINKDIEEVDCNMVLADVMVDITKKVSESRAVIVSDNLPVINGYRSELKQLFQNLAINAIKFRKPGKKPELKISSSLVNGQWQFAFSDKGIGIDKAHYERIFIIFQRLHTRSEYEGSGIGLSHCKKIVELHHGKIWVQSVKGEGSTFYFTIPETTIYRKPGDATPNR